jgi:hypothetical protein
MTTRNEAKDGRPWSATELDDLEHGLRIGVSIEVIADFIKRDPDEVRLKGLELGMLPKRMQLAEEAFD